MLNHIITLLKQYGYHLLDETKPGVYIHETEQQSYIVIVNRFQDNIDYQKYLALQRQSEFVAVTRYQKPVTTLHLILTENGMFEESVFELMEAMTNLWLAAEDTGRLYIFEKQIADFDGLYEYLSSGLQYNERSSRNEQAFRITPINILIVAVNILVFLGIILFNKDYFAVYDTDIMLKMGAMSYDTVTAGKWYQLVTSLFLHFGIGHLINNMILLTYAGCELERRIGKARYLILYLFSGIIGNMASLLFYHRMGEQVVSAGASGAIFGVIGALFIILLTNHIKTDNLTPNRLIFMAIITIYYGLTTVGVDNAAHIGGLFGGIIGGFLLSKISQYGKLV